jgi:molybdopterin/thiamine biosynthesis adenylyltransferase
MTFTGYLQAESERHSIDRVWSVGARFSLVREHSAHKAAIHSIFDRNIRAFGGEVQRVLSDLRVAVVGCGGTGSAVAEQIVRLGVRGLIVIDPDELSDSNITRVYGSCPNDVGRPKVDVLADHLQSIAIDVDVVRLNSKITLEPTARALIDADVVFGCTDDNAGRLVLSRLATYLLTPVIDCGVILTSDASGQLDGIHGRVTVLHPGAACLVCRDRVDLARAASEALTPAEHARRVNEGYAPALAGVEPAVVAYTTAVASQAVGELLERLVSYGPSPVPNEILLRIHEREISTNLAVPLERHYCHPNAGKLGLGITDPFLEQTWPS